MREVVRLFHSSVPHSSDRDNGDELELPMKRTPTPTPSGRLDLLDDNEFDEGVAQQSAASDTTDSDIDDDSDAPMARRVSRPIADYLDDEFSDDEVALRSVSSESSDSGDAGELEVPTLREPTTRRKIA